MSVLEQSSHMYIERVLLAVIFSFFVILEYIHLLWLTETAEDSYKLQISIEYMSKMTSKLSHYVLFMFHTASQLFWNWAVISLFEIQAVLHPNSRTDRQLTVIKTVMKTQCGRKFFPDSRRSHSC